MVAQLLARDGSDCWLCAYPMTQPPKRPNKRISLEHLTPRVLGGGDGTDNLVLCHQHCNGHLRDRPREKKLAIRKKWRAVHEARLCRSRDPLPSHLREEPEVGLSLPAQCGPNQGVELEGCQRT